MVSVLPLIPLPTPFKFQPPGPASSCIVRLNRGYHSNAGNEVTECGSCLLLLNAGTGGELETGTDVSEGRVSFPSRRGLRDLNSCDGRSSSLPPGEPELDDGPAVRAVAKPRRGLESALKRSP